MIRAENLTIRAGQFHLDGISFDVPKGKYCAVMGRTGSGKTTLLETLCGLKAPESGRLLIDGVDATKSKAAERGIGYCPQDSALFLAMTVRRQIGFALEIRKRPKSEIDARVAELAELLEIGGLLDRRPFGLSGGEKQRISLARALAHRPQVLCLDEPLSALDDETKAHLIELLDRVHHETGVTALHVTHSRQEAAQLADMYLRIIDGRIEEVISPGDAELNYLDDVSV